MTALACKFRVGQRVVRVAATHNMNKMMEPGMVFVVQEIVDAPDDLNDGCIKLYNASGYWNPDYFDKYVEKPKPVKLDNVWGKF